MKEEALEYIEKSKEITTGTRFVRHGSGIDDMMVKQEYEIESIRLFEAKEAIDLALKDMVPDIRWIKIDEENPLPKFKEVLAYNKEWIDEDFNPTGIRIGYLQEEGNFVSAVYDSDSEEYGCCYEEGDDYDTSQTQEDGTIKTWFHRGGLPIEGYRPNMPTHYMFIPEFK